MSKAAFAMIGVFFSSFSALASAPQSVQCGIYYGSKSANVSANFEADTSLYPISGAQIKWQKDADQVSVLSEVESDGQTSIVIEINSIQDGKKTYTQANSVSKQVAATLAGEIERITVVCSTH